jgi:hypothetical protein
VSVNATKTDEGSYKISVSMETPSFLEWIEKHANFFAIFGLAIEFPAVLAFSFDVSIPWPSTINKIFQFVIFNFPSIDNSGYWIGFWVAVIFVVSQVTAHSHGG